MKNVSDLSLVSAQIKKGGIVMCFTEGLWGIGIDPDHR